MKPYSMLNIVIQTDTQKLIIRYKNNQLKGFISHRLDIV